MFNAASFGRGGRVFKTLVRTATRLVRYAKEEPEAGVSMRTAEQPEGSMAEREAVVLAAVEYSLIGRAMRLSPLETPQLDSVALPPP